MALTVSAAMSHYKSSDWKWVPETFAADSQGSTARRRGQTLLFPAATLRCDIALLQVDSLESASA
jgi:hypothetical protein